MRYLILIIFVLLIARNTCAENFICYDNITKNITKVIKGDCLRLGICSGYNNTGMLPNCFEATAQEFKSAKGNYKKVDMLIVSGSRVVSWDQSDIDADVAQKQTEEANNKKAEAIAGLDDPKTQALINVFRKELNLVRSKVSLPDRSENDIKNDVKNEINK